jgi:outer membrane protein OmpA-like peptidoglycan-associated protein
MNANSLILASALAVAAACGPDPAPGPPVAVGPPAAGVASEIDDARTGIPRVSGDDVSSPEITTRTTLLADNRPATVATLPGDVLFDFGSAALRPEAEAALAAAAELIRRQPAARAEVAGHTDAVGPAGVNQSLSVARAAAVVDWLVDHGLPRDRLRAAGYGATRPVAGNGSEEDRRHNRRVEITVSEQGGKK